MTETKMEKRLRALHVWQLTQRQNWGHLPTDPAAIDAGREALALLPRLLDAIDGLVGQQAMPDDAWRAVDREARALLARAEEP